MTTHCGLLAREDVVATWLPAQETPFMPSSISESLSGVVGRITRSYELSQELAPWLAAGEDTIRRLDRLIE